MKAKKMKTMPELPQELVEAILLRLPVQSLSRFESVSKSWCSLIKSHHFSRKYLGANFIIMEAILLRLPEQSLARLESVCKAWRNLIRSHNFARRHLGAKWKIMVKLMDQPQRRFKSVPYDTNYQLHGDVASDEVGFRFDYEYDQYLFNTCDGLFVVFDYADHSLVIWNPLTGEWKQLPEAPRDGRWLDCGIGYDPITADYKVLLFESEDIEEGLVEVKLYTLCTNSWRLLTDIPYRPSSFPQTMTVVGNALHLFVKKTSGLDDSDLIISFDLSTEEFGEVPHPDFGDRLLQANFVASDSILCVAAVFDNPRETQIWKMEQYGVKESWTTLIILPFEGVYAVHLAVNDRLLLHFPEGGESKLLYLTLKEDDEGRLSRRNHIIESAQPEHNSVQVYVENSLIRL